MTSAQKAREMIALPLELGWCDSSGDALTQDDVILGMWSVLPLNFRRLPDIQSIYVRHLAVQFQIYLDTHQEGTKPAADSEAGREWATQTAFLEDETVEILLALAQILEIRGVAKKKKDEILDLIRYPAPPTVRKVKAKKMTLTEANLDAFCRAPRFEAFANGDGTLKPAKFSTARLSNQNIIYMCKQRGISGYSHKKRDELLEYVAEQWNAASDEEKEPEAPEPGNPFADDDDEEEEV